MGRAEEEVKVSHSVSDGELNSQEVLVNAIEKWSVLVSKLIKAQERTTTSQVRPASLYSETLNIFSIDPQRICDSMGSMEKMFKV